MNQRQRWLGVNEAALTNRGRTRLVHTFIHTFSASATQTVTDRQRRGVTKPPGGADPDVFTVRWRCERRRLGADTV